MHKKVVQRVAQETLNFLVKLGKKSNGSDVRRVIKLLYGKIILIKNIVRNTGSNSGLKKVTAFVNFANYRVIAILNLRA